MDQITNDEFKELLTLTRENHQMLKMLHRQARWQMIMRVVYYLFILGALSASYYFIQPYLQGVLTMYGQAQTSLHDITNLKSNIEGVFGN